MPIRTKKTDRAEVISRTLFENVSYLDKEAPGREFNDCKFHKCNLYGVNFDGSIFNDCVFDGCDLSLIKVKNCSMVNIQIINSKAIGILWNETTNLISLKFSHSTLDYSSFFSKNLKKMQVKNCRAHEVDFSICNLIESDFEGTDLLNAVFRDCDISKANFVDARNYNINLQINTAKQAKFNMPEALSLFDSFGIVVA